MSGIFSITGNSAPTGLYDYNINQSLRFEDGDNPNLSKSWSTTASSTTAGTFSAWVKRGNLGITTMLLSSHLPSPLNASAYIYFDTTDQLKVYLDSSQSGSDEVTIATDAIFRDVSSWYHVHVKYDVSQSTTTDKAKVYVNGTQQSTTASTLGSAVTVLRVVTNGLTTKIGQSYDTTFDFDGYIAELHYVDGQSLDPTSFGKTKAGIWIPKQYSGSYGTNGFYLDFADGSALGDDESVNTNDFTASGLAATDVVLDSPTNNWCTLNPLFTNGGTTQNFAEGNLKFTADSGYALANGTFAMRSGKWYWETLIQTQNISNVGITRGTNANTTSYVGFDSNGNVFGFGYQSTVIYGASGDGTASGATLATSQTSYTTGDIIGCSFDADVGELKFYKNNSLVYTISSINEHDWMPANSGFGTSNVNIVNFGQDSSFAGNKTAQGNADSNGVGDFYYSPPSGGFLALCTANLPDPAIDPAEDEEPADYFNTVLYTGNGVSQTDTQAISGVGFSPDFTWIKNRTDAAFHVLNDRVRGAGKNIFSNSTFVENSGGASTGDLFTSFDSDGFTVNYQYAASTNGGTNANSKAYVAWNWLAGGSAVSNTDGTITSSVSANTEAGFSVATWTGNATAGATIGHGLNSAPEMLWIKDRDDSGYNWVVYSKDVGNDRYLLLNSPNGQSTSGQGFLNSTTPSNSVVTLGGTGWGLNQSGDSHVGYFFHSVDGYSRVGKYTGNNSTDGTFVYTGHRVAWVMIKCIDGGGTSWIMYDAKRNPFNDVDKELDAEGAVTEGTSHSIDFLSNGFKIRSQTSNLNDSGLNYLFISFSDQPFKYSNAR